MPATDAARPCGLKICRVNTSPSPGGRLTAMGPAPDTESSAWREACFPLVRRDVYPTGSRSAARGSARQGRGNAANGTPPKRSESNNKHLRCPVASGGLVPPSCRRRRMHAARRRTGKVIHVHEHRIEVEALHERACHQRGIRGVVVEARRTGGLVAESGLGSVHHVPSRMKPLSGAAQPSAMT